MALCLDDPEVLCQLRRRGFVALCLTPQERLLLERARQLSLAFLSMPQREAAKYRGSARHPQHNRLALHGLGYVFQPGYADRRQFHHVAGASDVCPWPAEGSTGEGAALGDFRATFESGAALLSSLCVRLLEQVDVNAAAEWRSQVLEHGDPSVCDAFLYPAAAAAVAKSAEEREAMCSHLDPGWFTLKQGSLDGGLEVFDRSSQASVLQPRRRQLLGGDIADSAPAAWVNVEEATFYGPGGGGCCGRDVANSADGAAAAPLDVVVVFAGERLASWTEDEIPAVPHRALTCGGDRLSFIFELRDHAC